MFTNYQPSVSENIKNYPIYLVTFLCAGPLTSILARDKITTSTDVVILRLTGGSDMGRMIYHGSAFVVTSPEFGKERDDNDYGRGFYCTEDTELAKEWAAVDENGGFLNCYEIADAGMKGFDLTLPDDRNAESNVLQWLAVLLENRNLRLGSPIEKRGKEYILSNYLPDLSGYDYLIGYRADDSYFSFARAFLNNTITVGQLSAAMHFGELGLQYVLKSKRIFKQIRFLEAIPVNGDEYWPRRRKRDETAREKYRKMLEEEAEDGLYLNMLISGARKKS